MTTVGDYYVIDTTANVRSDVFRIAGDVYRDVLVQAVRMLYYQRDGTSKLAQRAGAAYGTVSWGINAYDYWLNNGTMRNTAQHLWVQDHYSDVSGATKWNGGGEGGQPPGSRTGPSSVPKRSRRSPWRPRPSFRHHHPVRRQNSWRKAQRWL